MPSGPYPPQSNNAIGTGVQPQPSGWTSSGQSVVQTNPVSSSAPNQTGFTNSGVAPVSTFGTNTSSMDPRAGGMQAIDMTGAPLPPGYQPSNSTMSVSVPPPQTPTSGWGSPNAGYPATGYPATGYPERQPCSHDSASELSGQRLSQHESAKRFVTLPVESLRRDRQQADTLARLEQRRADQSSADSIGRGAVGRFDSRSIDRTGQFVR